MFRPTRETRNEMKRSWGKLEEVIGKQIADLLGDQVNVEMGEGKVSFSYTQEREDREVSVLGEARIDGTAWVEFRLVLLNEEVYTGEVLAQHEMGGKPSPKKEWNYERAYPFPGGKLETVIFPRECYLNVPHTHYLRGSAVTIYDTSLLNFYDLLKGRDAIFSLLYIASLNRSKEARY